MNFLKIFILFITNKNLRLVYNNTNVLAFKNKCLKLINHSGEDMTKNDTICNINFFELYEKKKLLDKLTSNINDIEKLKLIENNEIKTYNITLESLLKDWNFNL
jgi:hypothetical protein